MPTKETERIARYDRKAMTRISIKLHNVNDKDILQAIEREQQKTGSKQGAVKSLIRKGLK